MQKIPMVIPKRERKVPSLFFHDSCRAIFRLLSTISSVRSMEQIYRLCGRRGRNLFEW
jgi:hypothetical protein